MAVSFGVPKRRAPWKAGPAPRTDGLVVVSVTELVAHHWRDLPGMLVAGLRLRAGWERYDGAIGLSLWSDYARRRSGSIAVWESEDALRSFVRHPDHVPIMRKYRERCDVRSLSWETENFRIRDAYEEAFGRLAAV
jgi:hypothetical protein